MKLSIRYKLLPVIVLGVVALASVFYTISIQSKRSAVEKSAIDRIQSAKQTFYNLEKNDVKMLKAALISFATNEDYKDIFLENDRSKLYHYGQNLFLDNKKLGITHFYFHRKNGTVFSRLHDEGKFDDSLNRITFNQSKKTGSWGTGIELGKTAFALRVVTPYFKEGDLIGYVEFGEEIDHFIEIMKDQTEMDYAVVVGKQFIDAKDWTSVRESKGLDDNYDELRDYVVIDTTLTDPSIFKNYVFSPDDLTAVTDKGKLIKHFELGGKYYVGGGFSLYDAGNKKVGAVITLDDFTAVEQTYQKAGFNMLLITLAGTLIISMIMILVVSLVVIWPLDKVVNATTRVVGGDFTAKVEVKSNDEIGTLAKMIEEFKRIMVDTAQELEQLRRNGDR